MVVVLVTFLILEYVQPMGKYTEWHKDIIRQQKLVTIVKYTVLTLERNYFYFNTIVMNCYRIMWNCYSI